MEVNRLLGDEIVYELTIRGLPVQRLVNDNRATLRGALRMERQGILSSFHMLDLNPEQEFDICRRKIQDLGNDLARFERGNADNEYKRIQSRLFHVHLRLRRIPVGREVSEEDQKVLLGDCLRLIDELENVYEEVTRVRDRAVQPNVNVLDGDVERQGSILDEPNLLIPENIAQTSISLSRSQGNYDDRVAAENLIFLSQNPQRLRASEQRPEVTQVSYSAEEFQPPCSSRRATLGTEHLCANFDGHQRQGYSRPELAQQLGDRLQDLRLSGNDHSFEMGAARYVDVSRWRLQFDGESSVTSFLERVEELRLSRNVSHEQLLRSAVELFTKDALLWFRTQHFSSWSDLVDKLKRDFQPYDYSLDLWDEIRKRTQGSKERVVTYVAAVENLFNRLGSGKPEEKTRVDWIKRGLLPHIQSQLALQVVQTVPELIRLSRMVEETIIRTERFCPPPTNVRGLLEPDLAYHKPPSNTVHNLPSCSTVQVGKNFSSEVFVQEEQSGLNLPLCWNCGKRGHRFKKCSEPRKIFCYRCGLDKVVAKSCPNCTKNGRGGPK